MGPGGAPAAAQRRGRTTWTREETPAGWAASREGGGDPGPGWCSGGGSGSHAHLSIAASRGDQVAICETRVGVDHRQIHSEILALRVEPVDDLDADAFLPVLALDEDEVRVTFMRASSRSTLPQSAMFRCSPCARGGSAARPRHVAVAGLARPCAAGGAGAGRAPGRLAGEAPRTSRWSDVWRGPDPRALVEQSQRAQPVVLGSRGRGVALGPGTGLGQPRRAARCRLPGGDRPPSGSMSPAVGSFSGGRRSVSCRPSRCTAAEPPPSGRQGRSDRAVVPLAGE